MKLCKRCNKNKENHCFGTDKKSKSGLMTYCKECSREYARNRYHSLSIEQKRVIFKKEKASYLERIKNNPPSIKEKIHVWARIRSSSNSSRLDRSSLDKDFLKEKAMFSLLFFDYLEFYNRREYGNLLISASLDRKNNDLPYQEDNCLVVPNWLNLAKGIGTYKELIEYINHFLEKYENMY